jgi:hypothetical protein
MNQNKLKATITKYKNLFAKSGLKPIRHPDDTLAIDYKQELEHCLWMLNEIEDKLDNILYLCDSQEKTQIMEKINRWLGFIQGVFFTQSMATINDLKNDNRENEVGTTEIHNAEI